ncbi:proteasome maturation factor UMP1 [Jimgerdemannia flammicorona]|uniref:Proteasome maturation factor UMP1 n=1 Tax=Jimgerdemannia flammicorona TaxID=994334 RepID=A0A433DI03_9FUNG|nr:proteasome maturation factor UMP1 [Jimgerdemannia flammicorona]
MSAPLRLAPAAYPEDSLTKSTLATSNSFGVHDTMRHGVRSIQSEVLPGHPLEQRLKHWQETQYQLKLSMYRNLYGIHAPVRHLMERSIVSKVQRLPVLPSSNLGLEILTGQDETIDFEDFLNTPENSTDMLDVHAAMEHKLGMKF